MSARLEQIKQIAHLAYVVPVAPKRKQLTVNRVAAEPTPVKASAVFVEDRFGRFLVDTETGEVILADRKLPEPKQIQQYRVEAYVGIDTAWPAKARDAAELTAALSPFDHWLDALHIDEGKILGLLDQGVSADALRILKYLAERLSGRNYWFGRMNEIDPALNMPTRSRERAVAELVKCSLIEVGATSKHWPTRVSVHPWYAFRGDLQAREQCLAAWANLAQTVG